MLRLTADAFCRVNASYVDHWPSLLELDPLSIFPISRCESCAFVYSDLLPNPAFLRRLYDEVIGEAENVEINYSPASLAARMRYVSELLSMPGIPRAPRALDYGCGLGFTGDLLEYAGVRTVGFDVSASRVAYASTRKHIILSSHGELMERRPFDLIVADNVLEHLADPVSTLEFIASVAAPGAIMYVSVPNCDRRFIASQQRAASTGRQIDMSINPWEHLNYFDIKHLDEVMRICGFVPISDAERRKAPDIGLRAETHLSRRLKNVISTTIRLARFGATGNGIRSPNSAFFRYEG